ncbi:hypothetical protein RH858_08115 [Halalkaliarchaeum sp. AArc-GB]|uniref:hypothetical protein n=1 Tax=Halalkaliarchaeum sp. AArc-GB TaxID=3074078 RepID=UPI00285FED8C|nr:hypothetical protein [Halalkaliarchaeum sp. AArc-GB]MDR5673113.1 hypothetical protein [Halalkaliarchaeum sp. AArc-GB]
MQRRKFVIGMGSLVAGGAAAMGSGAFSAMTADREANINVVDDTDGLIALDASDEASDTVSQTDNGELSIDFTSEEGGKGVNVNSRYQVGTFHHTHDLEDRHVIGKDPYTHSTTMSAWGYAFSVTNQSDESRDITLSFEATQEEVEGYLGFGCEYGGWTDKYFEIYDDQVEDSTEFTDVSPGETILVSFVVSTLDVENFEEEDLSGTFTVSAE